MIKFVLNGAEAAYDGSAADRLLEVLRDTYDCKSVKCGCKEGECGACAVLIDGTLINSCCVAMGAAEGASVVTLPVFGNALCLFTGSTVWHKMPSGSAVQRYPPPADSR